MKTYMTLVIGILLTFAGACSHSDLGERTELDALRVHTATAEAVMAPERLVAPGQVSSWADSFVSAKSMGTVVAIHVKAGNSVQQGQSLLEIDSSDIQSKLQQAQGALAQAQAARVIAENNYKRYQELYERKAASKVELEQMKYQFDTANGAVQMAEGAVSEARSYMKYASVKSPFDAIVVERMVNLGDFAAPGRPLFRLIDPKKMEFVCQVSESDARYVSTGTPVSVEVDTLDTPLNGIVREVAGGSDFLTHSVRVHIHLEEIDGLNAGMYGIAHFSGIERSRVLIPGSWIVHRGELNMVFVRGADGRAQMRLIRTGKLFDDKVEVISGLDGGEQIVTSNLNRIRDGVKLEVF